MSSFHELRIWLRSDGVDGPSEKVLTALLRHLPDLSPPVAWRMRSFESSACLRLTVVCLPPFGERVPASPPACC